MQRNREHDKHRIYTNRLCDTRELSCRWLSLNCRSVLSDVRACFWCCVCAVRACGCCVDTVWGNCDLSRASHTKSINTQSLQCALKRIANRIHTNMCMSALCGFVCTSKLAAIQQVVLSTSEHLISSSYRP